MTQYPLELNVLVLRNNYSIRNLRGTNSSLLKIEVHQLSKVFTKIVLSNNWLLLQSIVKKYFTTKCQKFGGGDRAPRS